MQQNEHSEYLDLVRSGQVDKGTHGSRKRKYTFHRFEEISQTPLEESGFLLRIQPKFPYNLLYNNSGLYRLIRVPLEIPFHQLHGILSLALGFSSADSFYSFELWDAEPRSMLDGPHPDLAEEPKEVLVEDPGTPEFGYQVDLKSSKMRSLRQVFMGGRIWPGVPYRSEYYVNDLNGRRWDYAIEFQGLTLWHRVYRPGQEAFCLEGEGWSSAEHQLYFYRTDPHVLYGQGATCERDAIDNVLENWWWYAWRKQMKRLQ